MHSVMSNKVSIQDEISKYDCIKNKVDVMQTCKRQTSFILAASKPTDLLV